VYYRGERIRFTELQEPIPKPAPPLPPAARPVLVRKAKPEHPWRQGYQKLPKHEATGSAPGDRRAARWNTHFRFALKNRASLQCASQRQNQPQKGDISN
jgi:hypothetical protein